MASRRHPVVAVVVLLALALVVGEGIPRLTLGDSTAPYAGMPEAHAVAVAALARARAPYGGTVGRLLFPAERVIVSLHPSNCPAHSGAADTPRRAYEARVQLYTLFDIRGPLVHVSCGGTQSSWVAPA